jgi:ketosteroid isomerase-like protein
VTVVRLLAVAAALLALAGCGGGGEGKNVKEAITQFLSARETGDAAAVCDALTPDGRRLVEVIARGLRGPGGACEDVVEEQLGGGGGLDARTVEAIDSSDVDIEGDKARVKGRADDERLPMEKVGGSWRVALEDLPMPGYGLRGTAACTERTLQTIDRPLPAPTRAGISRDAARDAKNLDDLARLLERGEPPEGKEDAQRRVVATLKANARDWDRAARAIRGLRAPLSSYNRALRATEKRAEAAEDALVELQVGCLGDARTLATAAEFRRDAHRICRAAARRIQRTPEGPRLLRQLADVGRDAERRLRRLEPPPSLARPYRGALQALATAYDELGRAGGASNPDRAAERIELLGLRSSIAFFRIGLPRCAQL